MGYGHVLQRDSSRMKILVHPQSREGDNLSNVSVLIAYYHGEKVILDCVSSIDRLLGSEQIPHDILIFDNESSPTSCATLGELSKSRGVSVVSCGKNIGFGPANNELALAATGDYLLLLNQDTVTASIGELRSFLNRRDGNTVAVPLLRNANGTRQPQIFRYPTLASATAEAFGLKNLAATARQRHWRTCSDQTTSLAGRWPLQRRYPSGAAVLVPRKAFEDAGGFDGRIRLYHEECLLFHHLGEMDMSCQMIPGFVVSHFGAGGEEFSSERLCLYFVNLCRSYQSIVSGRRAARFRVIAFSALTVLGLRLRIVLLLMGLPVPYSPAARAYATALLRTSLHERHHRALLLRRALTLFQRQWVNL